jgi:hypothetical protein
MRGGYHGYFAGPPAVGLLLIRWAAAANYCAIGFVLCTAAASTASIAQGAGLASIGVAWIACGGLSAVGLASRIALTIAALLNASWFVRVVVLQSSLTLSAEQWNLLFSACVALGLALVGPGAYSADAYFFGRREIDISRLRQKHY